jgi:archaellum component FlaF (FlaF/FlaG flagellin family)
VVTGTYSNGTTRTETIAPANVTGFNSSAAAASQTLTITVNGKTATYTVQIVAPTLASIAITTPANKTVYTVGDPLDLTGLVVTGTDSNGTTKAETIAPANVTGFNSRAAAASQTLTITVPGTTATYTVQIVAPTLASIAYTTPYNKTFD